MEPLGGVGRRERETWEGPVDICPRTGEES